MKFTPLITLLFASSVLASNAGIFGSDGQVQSAPVARDAILPARSPTYKRETNASRMRRGLSPLPPTRRAPGHLKPRTSSVPCTPVNTQGIIAINKVSDGSLLGYVSHTYDSQNSYTYTSSIASAQTFSIPSTTSFNTPIDITAVSGPDATYPDLGAVGGSGGYNFGTGKVGYAYLSGSGSTPAGSPPSSTAGNSIESLGYNAPSESQIWTLDCSLGITAQWTNSDSSQPATSIFYDPSVNFLGILGDLSTFTTNYNDGSYLVTFTFIPA